MVWSRATLTIENIGEGCSVVRQFVELIFAALQPTLTAIAFGLTIAQNSATHPGPFLSLVALNLKSHESKDAKQ